MDSEDQKRQKNMKRTFRFVIWLVLILTAILLSVYPAAASASDVQLAKPVMRENYIPYGEYLKCGETAEAFVILYNPTDESYPITLPSSVRLSGGESHPFTNYSADQLTDTSEYFRNKWKKSVPFTNPFILPPRSTWLLSGTISNMDRYNIQWTVDIFMTIKIGDLTKNLQGMLWQRGNGCGADAIVHSTITEAYYDDDGNNGSVTMRLVNKMPDVAYITMSDKIQFAAVNATGTASNVTWNQTHINLAPEAAQVVRASFSLEKGVAASNESLSIKTILDYPTSLFFGHLETDGTALKRGDLSGVINANYQSDGSSGNVEAVFSNKSANAFTLTLPETGVVSIPEAEILPKSGGMNVQITWRDGSTLTVPANGSTTVSGTFTFSDPVITGTNKYLWLALDIRATDASGANSSIHAAGVAERNPDPNPTITPVSFCRDYALTSANTSSTTITFQYTIQNNAHINMMAQLAKSMAVQGVKNHAAIQYKACSSGSANCINRIDENYYLTLNPLEIVTVTGSISVPGSITVDNKWIWTSMIYYSEESEVEAFSLGYATNSCQTPIVTPTPGGDDPNPTISAISFCRSYQTAAESASSTEIVFQYAIKNNSKYEMAAQLASTMAIQGISTYPVVSYTACLSDETDCIKRIDRRNNITLNGYETILVKGKVTAPIALTTPHQWIWTSMLYFPSGSEKKAVALGYARNTCDSGGGGTDQPDSSVSALSFCRDYQVAADGDTKTDVTFQYTIQNNAQTEMRTQLATTMAIQGNKGYPLITYTSCVSGENSCMDRIDDRHYITLNATEKITLSGTVIVPIALKKSDQWIWTSMVYFPEGAGTKAFSLGYAKSGCAGISQ